MVLVHVAVAYALSRRSLQEPNHYPPPSAGAGGGRREGARGWSANLHFLASSLLLPPAPAPAPAPADGEGRTQGHENLTKAIHFLRYKCELLAAVSILS